MFLFSHFSNFFHLFYCLVFSIFLFKEYLLLKHQLIQYLPCIIRLVSLLWYFISELQYFIITAGDVISLSAYLLLHVLVVIMVVVKYFLTLGNLVLELCNHQVIRAEFFFVFFVDANLLILLLAILQLKILQLLTLLNINLLPLPEFSQLALQPGC